MRSGQCRWRCPFFCLRALGWRIPMSVFPAGCRRTKKASRQGGFLVVDKERCYFFMMRVVAMPLAVATRTTYTPGARPSTLA